MLCTHKVLRVDVAARPEQAAADAGVALCCRKMQGCNFFLERMKNRKKFFLLTRLFLAAVVRNNF